MYLTRPASTSISGSLSHNTVQLATRPSLLTPAEAAMFWISVRVASLDGHGMMRLTAGLEKLSSIVRSGQADPPQDFRPASTTPTPWDDRRSERTRGPERISDSSTRAEAGENGPFARHRPAQSFASSQGRTSSRSAPHTRNDSGLTGTASSTDFDSQYNASNRRHDYDVQSMETSLSSPPGISKNAIPPPSVTVRSEFPTIHRSRQQQSLTCLVTIEVPERKGKPGAELSPLPPMTTSRANSMRSVKKVTGPKPFVHPYLSAEALDEVTEELYSRVDNWHGLDFSR